MKQIRIYADTSVFGGCFDQEYQKTSRELFNQVRAGQFHLVISATTLRELGRAPSRIQERLSDLPKDQVEEISLTSEILELRDLYLNSQVVGPSSSSDAEHIACASVAGADLIVSWNFKHIVT